MAVESFPTIDWEAPEFQAGIESAVAAIADLQEGGVVRSQRGIELIGYDAAFELARDPRFSMGMPDRMQRAGVTSGAAHESFLNFLFSREGVDHVRARRAGAPYFTASSADRLRQVARGWIDSWLDENINAQDDFDFLQFVSNPLPSTLYCHMVGAPLSDADFIHHMSEEVMLLTAPPGPGHGERIEKAAGQTKEYLLKLIGERRANPGDDLLSALVAAEVKGEIDESDILAVAFNSLVGSTDTTSAQICLNLQALSDNPDQWAILKAEPERVPHAVMELMRFNPGAWTIVRSPLEPLEYRGIQLTPEDTLFPSPYAANSDPAVYENPRKLDVTRSHPKAPLNFGAGRHSCLGRMITLMEQEEVLRAVLTKWESFEVTSAAFTGAMFSMAPVDFKLKFKPVAG